MHDHRVKVRNQLDNSTESQWIRTQYESGIPIEEIVKNVDREIGGIGPGGAHTRLGVEYILGKKSFEDIQHLITPHIPNSLEFLGSYPDGYLYQASGVSEGASFKVLLDVPNSIQEQRVRDMVDKNQPEICFLAYKRAHEGHPAEYESGKNAEAIIRMDMLAPLLND